jgi:hypothetical protein
MEYVEEELNDLSLSAMVKKAYTTYKVRCDRHSYNGNQIKGHD